MHAEPAGSERRGFLRKFLAVVIGGFVSLFPAAAGLAVFVDPLRSRKPDSSGGGQEGFLKVASLDSLLVGSPRRVTVINDRVDAWNLFPQEPVGAVYLLRNDEGSVLALNVVCPHAGCPVDFDPDKKAYQCPCHKSSFQLDGNILNPDSPAPRGLDSLLVDQEKLKSGEVWIKFQNFQSGKAERISEV
jgi:menaquinol-cytochrome c reductase iron-sulfur subunit